MRERDQVTERETVTGDSQGVRLAMMQELARCLGDGLPLIVTHGWPGSIIEMRAWFKTLR